MSNTYFNISNKLRLYEFDGMLDQYGDAAAAYSLRKLRNGYTGNAIRVRRSSDDTERDMGFYDNELDTVALLDWVNAEINIADYNVISNAAGAIATKLADFTYKATSSGTAGSTIRPKITFTTATAGNSYRLIITPSNQTGAINFKLYDGSSYIITGNDLAEGIDTTFTANGGVFLAFDGNQVFNVDFTIELNALTADGHVQTWYDQSANANHAVQNTDTAQPKIVDAGTLVAEGGNTAIQINDGLFFNSNFHGIATLDYFTVGSPSRNTYIHVSETSNGGNYSWVAKQNDAATGIISGFGAPTLYANGVAQSVSTRDDVYQATYGYKLLSTLNASTSSWSSSRLFGYGSVYYYAGTIQEMIFYNNSKSSEQADIETNINTYYSIY